MIAYLLRERERESTCQSIGLSTESMSPGRSRCVRLWSVGPDGGRCTHVRLDRSRLARSSLALASARFRALSLALDTCRRRWAAQADGEGSSQMLTPGTGTIPYPSHCWGQSPTSARQQKLEYGQMPPLSPWQGSNPSAAFIVE